MICAAASYMSAPALCARAAPQSGSHSCIVFTIMQILRLIYYALRTIVEYTDRSTITRALLSLLFVIAMGHASASLINFVLGVVLLKMHAIENVTVQSSLS